MLLNSRDAPASRSLQTLLTLGPTGNRSDADLLDRFVAGSGTDAAELAFATLVERHAGAVVGVARRILGDEASSLDAAQATFLVLARRARSLRVGESLAPWLAAVARRVARGLRREQARRRRHETAAARPDRDDSAPATDPAATAEVARIVLDEVDRLPEPFRRAVVACHLDGLTQHDAARHLGWPVGTLQSRLDRGRRRLRDRLTRRGLAPSILPVLVPVPLPAGWAVATTRAAVTLILGQSASGLIGPGVVALLPTTAGTLQGVLMTKLNLGAVVLATTCAAAGSGWVLGVGSTLDRSAAVASGVATTTAPTVAVATSVLVDQPTPARNEPEPGTVVGFANPNGDVQLIPIHQPMPTLLWFAGTEGRANRDAVAEVARLQSLGYPVRKIDSTDKAAEPTRNQYNVEDYPTFVVATADGKSLGQKTGRTTAQELAELYNSTLPGHRPASGEPVFNLEAIPSAGVVVVPGSAGPAFGPEDPSESHLEAPPAPSNEDIPPPAGGPGLPTLLCFVGGPDDAKAERMPSLSRLGALGYPIRVLDYSRANASLRRHHITSVPSFVVRDEADDTGRELGRLERSYSLGEIARFYNDHRPKVDPTSPVPVESEPPLIAPGKIARPWDATVRINFRTEKGERLVTSGVVVASDATNSFVLTSALPFVKLDEPPPAGQQRGSTHGLTGGRIMVDLFDTSRERANPTRVPCTTRNVPCDQYFVLYQTGLALLRLQPGGSLPVAELLPSDRSPAPDEKLIAAGCSFGLDATAWDDRVQSNGSVRFDTLLLTGQYQVLIGQHQAVPGRQGGGLFTAAGLLAGIAGNDGSDAREAQGFYIGPRMIHIFLGQARRNEAFGFRRVSTPSAPTEESSRSLPQRALGADDPMPDRSEPANPARVSNTDRRIDELERKLDRLLEKLDNKRGEVPTGPPPLIVQ